MKIINSHHAVNNKISIYPPLWDGDAATVAFSAFKRRFDARLRYVDGLPVLRPWPGSDPSPVFHNIRISEAVHRAHQRAGGTR